MSTVAAVGTADPILHEPRTSWTERLNAGFMRLDPEHARALGGRVASGAIEGGVWIEQAGRRAPIALALRPRLLDLACRGYLHHVTWQVRSGLRRIVRLVAAVPQAAAAMPLEPAEQEWFDRYRQLGRRYGNPRAERIFCRLDALGRLEGAGWRQRLRFMEANVVGIGGMSYTPPAEALMLEHAVPAMASDEDELAFDLNHDPRTLLVDELFEHARALGCSGLPRIAFVDDRSLYTLGGELGRLVPWLRDCGIDAVYCDARELEVGADGETVIAEGRRVDVVYRFLEIRDLAEMEAGGDRLAGLHLAFARNMVVPSVGGDLEHKSAFELLTDPSFAIAFDPDLRVVLQDHVLWTRLLRERRTTGPDGEPVDLVPWVARHRERLVIKPNRGAGGEGVMLGAGVDAGGWDDALGRALAAPDAWVVQAMAPVDVETFPVLGADGAPALAPMYCAAGFFPGRRGLAVFGRYAPTPVVNIQSGGGIAPFLVAVR